MRSGVSLFVGAAFLTFFSYSVVAGDSSKRLTDTDNISDREIAIEAYHQDMASANAQIKSRQELIEYALQHKGGNNLFTYLKPASRSEFLSGLTFSEKGLSGFNYRILEQELTYSQAYKLLALFGMQHIASSLDAKVSTPIDLQIKNSPGAFIMADHQGYSCESRATCVKDVNRICTSNC